MAVSAPSSTGVPAPTADANSPIGEQQQAAARFDLDPRAAGASRVFVSDLLAEWSLAGLTDSACLVISELVTNAIRHCGVTDARIRVDVAREGNSVTIGVSDPGSKHVPTGKRMASLDATCGRGLAIVQLIATASGIEYMPTNKRVWATLSSEGL